MPHHQQPIANQLIGEAVDQRGLGFSAKVNDHVSTKNQVELFLHRPLMQQIELLKLNHATEIVANPDPAAAISELNQRLSARFSTFVMCVLDPASHLVTVVNAGHRPPARRRYDGSIGSLGALESGFPFSVQDEAEFEATSFELLPGESIVMFSDGLEDAHDAVTDDYFGNGRIEAAIQQSDGTAIGMVTNLVRQVEAFSGDTGQLDDMCIVSWTRVV